MANDIPDAPDIARTLRTGYPGEPHFPPECPRCGDPMDTAYLIDGEWECGECFEGWLDELFTSDPARIADALEIPHWRVDDEQLFL